MSPLCSTGGIRMKFSRFAICLALVVTASLGFAQQKTALRNDDAAGPRLAVAGDGDAPSNAPSAASPAEPQAASGVRAQASVAAPETPVTYGFDERTRFEGYNNADFNAAKSDRLNQFRTRVRPFADINFTEYLEGYGRMGWGGVK